MATKTLPCIARLKKTFELEDSGDVDIPLLERQILGTYTLGCLISMIASFIIGILLFALMSIDYEGIF